MTIPTIPFLIALVQLQVRRGGSKHCQYVFLLYFLIQGPEP